MASLFFLCSLVVLERSLQQGIRLVPVTAGSNIFPDVIVLATSIPIKSAMVTAENPSAKHEKRLNNLAEQSLS